MDASGIVFEERNGERSTSSVGREVVATALGSVDAVGAAAARRQTQWRTGYPAHFRRLVEAGLEHDPEPIARAGLAALHSRMRFRAPGDDADSGLERALEPLGYHATGTVSGSAEPERELTLPYRGTRLRGDDVRRRLDGWVEEGVVEPGAADAVRAVLDHPEWLDLRDHTVAVLGAGAEMGPLRSLLRWGGRVAAVDLPRPDLWRGLLDVASKSAGTLLYPVASDGGLDDAASAGADLLHETGSVAVWLDTIAGPLVLGNYVYADGATNVRLAVAVDVLGEHLREQRDDVSLAFLATPTDVFVVPEEAAEQSRTRFAGRSLVRRPVAALSGGRLLRRQYAPGAGPAITDAIVPQQGPNYLLAKRVHRWRATTAAADGALVSMNVAPPTRTRSVTKNRALAAAYAGAHRFGIEVFDPATSNTLMAALLVHDLRTGGTPGTGWRAEAAQACHGGLWRGPYDPRSALGLAAVLGMTAARH